MTSQETLQNQLQLNKKNLIGLSYEELKQELSHLVEKPFQVKQIYEWIYKKYTFSFDKMTNISKDLRKRLDENFSLELFKIVDKKTSSDGSVKYLFELFDKKKIETVFMPQENRDTICVSSQVGCKFGCKFCLTGKMGFIRNLYFNEIVIQILQTLFLNKKTPDKRTNIVFMGMGEPLDNLKEVKKAIKIITDPNGLSISPKRITLSTIGIAENLEEFINEFPNVKIAISLNSPYKKKREFIMPSEKKYPIKETLKLLRKLSGRLRYRVTFEYVMLENVNDSIGDAKKLIEITKGIPRKFNLIPFNKFEGSEFSPSSFKKIEAFSKFLRNHRFVVTIRDSRGKDIRASCGNLYSKNER